MFIIAFMCCVLTGYVVGECNEVPYGTDEISRLESFKPHPLCRYPIPEFPTSNSSLQLVCIPQGPERSFSRYTLPVNFDIAKVHPRITSFTLKSASILETSVAVPELKKLRKIYLGSVNLLPRDPPLQLSSFLQEVKTFVHEIKLELVKLADIKSKDFSGFFRLRSLEISECQLNMISPDSFVGISAADLSGIPSLPQLSHVKLSHLYGVRDLDLVTFEPLRNSLKVLDLRRNRWKLSSNRYFTLDSLESINLNENNLTGVPKIILEALPRNRYVPIIADGNKLCGAASNCACCEMVPFLDRLVKFNQLHEAPTKCTKNGLKVNDVRRYAENCA